MLPAEPAFERFRHLVSRPDASVPLDEVAFCIAAQAAPALHIDDELARLDDVAERCFAPTLDALRRHLFVDLGFRGNRHHYYDPRNSYLNEVVERRLGIPISLAVLTITVGRRLGVPLHGIGMPGHFLLADKVDPDVFVDPFAGGAVLDVAGCEARFRAVHGEGVAFDPDHLRPIGNLAIVARMLNNLASVFSSRRDRRNLVWVFGLRNVMPDATHEDAARFASALAECGRVIEAADMLDHLSEGVGGSLGTAYGSSAARLRARLN